MPPVFAATELDKLTGNALRWTTLQNRRGKNHVYLEMKDPEIVDINGKVFKIKEVLGSKSRDLVILSYENADPKAEMLETADDVAAIPPSTPVIAYGNSLGDDVIVTQSGKLLGIGPDKIETDAPFVGGNSGGPVLTAKDEKVVGVATYLRYIEPNPTTAGSKYESSRFKHVVRRFATRIDNLSPDDLEPLTLADIERERNLVNAGEDCMEYIRKSLEGSLSGERFRIFCEDCVRKAQLLEEGETKTWHSSYLKKKFAQNRRSIAEIIKIINPNAEPGKRFSIDATLKQNADKLTPIEKRGLSVRCFFCKGSGRYTEKMLNPNYKSNAPSSRYLYKHISCPMCGGSKKRILWKDQLCFVVPEDVIQEIGKHIVVSEKEFNGFHLGETREREMSRFEFYRQKPLYAMPNPFGETLVYEGNHQDRDAACTILTFMFDRLLEVKVIAPGNNASRLREETSTLQQNGGPEPRYK